ncbi:MAG: hypothetical protein AAGI68_04105 [Planctomycetota bacterium]
MLLNLSKHPGVFIPDTKPFNPDNAQGEVHFFDRHWSRGLGWYSTLFTPGKGRLCGEKTPEYMFVPDAARRLAETLGEAKLIVVLRDPTRRLLSQMVMRQRRGRVLSVDQALATAEYAGRGRYAALLEENVYAQIDPARVLVIISDDHEAEIDRTEVEMDQLHGVPVKDASGLVASQMRRVHEFLGLPHVDIDYAYHNVTHYDLPATPDEIRRIYDYYRPENERLYSLLGRRIEAWEHADREAQAAVAHDQE